MSYNIPLLVSVRPSGDNPGIVLNQSKNVAHISLEEPIELPSGARNVSLGLRRFTYYYNFPNIQQGESMTLQYTEDDWKTSEDLAQVDFTSGLYDVTGFANAVKTSLDNQLGAINAALETDYASGGEILKFEPNWATEKMELVHGFEDWIAGSTDKKIKVVMTPRIVEVSGFEEETEITNETLHSFLAPNRARFNVVNSLIVRTNLLTSSHTTSILNASNVGDVIELIPIDVKPGFQGIFDQKLDQKIPIQLPASLTRFTVSVHNEHGDDIQMIDDWSVLLSLYFDLPQ